MTVAKSLSHETDAVSVTAWLRSTPSAYLSVLMLVLMLGAWGNYLADRLGPANFVLKGQSPGIVIPLVGFPCVVLAWLAYRRMSSRDAWVTVFLVSLAIAWPIHAVIAHQHGDQLTHTVWLYLPMIVLIVLKPPHPHAALTVALWFAWVASAILILTRVLEMTGVVPVFFLEPDIVAWEKENYWIPLSDVLGIDGRWPGPFGFNSKTGFIGALIIILALARWKRRNIFLLIVGVVTLLVTASRGSFLAAACGLLVLAAFTRSGPIARIPLTGRVVAFGVLLLGAAFVVLRAPTGLTGRATWIWPAFLDLWHTSPWFGVGQVGILADPEAGIPMEAHNLFIQELTRFGLVGLVVQYAPFILGLVLAVIAAFRGRAWPLAVLASFVVASMTEVFMDGWLVPSTYILLIILAVCATRGPREGTSLDQRPRTWAAAPS